MLQHCLASHYIIQMRHKIQLNGFQLTLTHQLQIVQQLHTLMLARLLQQIKLCNY